MPKEKTNYFNEIIKLEERNIQKARKYFSKDIEFWKETFNMLYEAFESIMKSYSDEWSYSKKAGVYMLPRLMMSTKTSLDLLIRGYYYDYTVVERSLWESMALLNLFPKDEESAKKWLSFERLDIPKWKLVHQLFSGPSIKKVTARINKAYAKQSHYVHSSFFAIFSEFLKHLSQKKRFFNFPRFKKSLIADVISTPTTTLALAYLVDLYQNELKENFKKKVIDLIGQKILEWEARGLLKKENLE